MRPVHARLRNRVDEIAVVQQVVYARARVALCPGCARIALWPLLALRPFHSLWPLCSLWPLLTLRPLLALRPLRSLCLHARIQFADKPVAVLADVRRRAGRPRQFRFLFRGQVVKGQVERLLRAFDVNAHWRALYAARAASLVFLHFIPP